MTPKAFMKTVISRDMPNLDYSPIVKRLSEDKKLIRLLHAAVGMSGETGEIVDGLKKSMMYGKELNKINLLEECGDLLWYIAVMLHELDSSFEEVMVYNDNKLKVRYPNGFTEEDAIQRADKVNSEEER